jgi:hypothetical protein
MANAPFQLWTSGKTSADDGVTAFGIPKISASKTSMREARSSAAATAANQPRVPAQFAGAVKSDAGWTSAATATPTGPQFSPLEPFREPTSPASSTQVTGPSLVPLNQLTATASSASILPPATVTSSITPIDVASSPTHRPTSPPKLVGSRTFALEYDLDDAGSEGVARVELWGTRDGGQTWNRYTVDNDNRSPLNAAASVNPHRSLVAVLLSALWLRLRHRLPLVLALRRRVFQNSHQPATESKIVARPLAPPTISPK